MWSLFDVVKQQGWQKYFYHFPYSQVSSVVLGFGYNSLPRFQFSWSRKNTREFYLDTKCYTYPFLFQEMQWRNSRKMTLSRSTFIHSVLTEKENMNLLPCAICWWRFCEIYASAVPGNMCSCFLWILLLLAIVNKIY